METQKQIKKRPYVKRKINLGWFKKGEGFWTGKKRPNLVKTAAFKTMFKKGQTVGKKNYMFGRRGELSPVWKGDSASYSSLHKWVKRYLGKATYCSVDRKHKSKQFGWGNISGEYKRELSDWHPLCNKCNINDGVKIHKRFKK